MSKPLATYTLELMAPANPLPTADALLDAVPRFQSALQETEENLTDLLPEGWTVRIKIREEHPNE